MIDNDNNNSSNYIQVKVLFFAKARELAGDITNQVLELPERKDGRYFCSDLLTLICDKYNLGLIRETIVLAVNEEYCELDGEVTIKTGDEIAVIPPLSGG